jgi:hypothetical protein
LPTPPTTTCRRPRTWPGAVEARPAECFRLAAICCLRLVWAVLDLHISHVTNGIKFTELERRHLKRMRYEGHDETTPEDITAAWRAASERP